MTKFEPTSPLAKNGAAEFEILLSANGVEPHAASNGRVCATVTADGKVFKRNAIKNALTTFARKEQWLVVELDGVRCYVTEINGSTHIVMTREELWP